MLAFFGMALGGAACGGWRIGLQQLCRIASLAHCGEQMRHIHPIHHLHRGALCCQIHGGVQHTGLLSEDALHTPTQEAQVISRTCSSRLCCGTL